MKPMCDFIPCTQFASSNVLCNTKTLNKITNVTVEYNHKPLCIETPPMKLDQPKKHEFCFAFTNLKDSYAQRQLLQGVSDIDHKLIGELAKSQMLSYDISAALCTRAVTIDSKPVLCASFPTNGHNISIIDHQYNDIHVDEFTDIKGLIDECLYCKALIHCCGLHFEDMTYKCKWEIIAMQMLFNPPNPLGDNDQIGNTIENELDISYFEDDSLFII